MRVLFVSMVPFECNSSVIIQNKGIIIGLSELGYKIDVISPRPCVSSMGYDDSMNNINGVVENFYYIDTNRKYEMIRAKKKENSSDFQKSFSKISFASSIYMNLRPFLKKIYECVSVYDAQKINVKNVSRLNIDFNKYDIIISASDPKSSHLIAERILSENKDCKARWIQYWGDPMLIDITRKSRWNDAIVKYYEQKIISKADRIIYASPITLEKQKQIYSKFSPKMDYANQVYSSFNINQVNYFKSKENDCVTFGYFGTYISDSRNIMPLYNAAKNSKAILNICGSSDVILQSTNNIYIRGNVTYSKAVEMEENSDVLVCICNNRGTQIPGKIYYCTGYNKPIIVVLDGEYKEKFKKYFESFNRFIICDNEENSIKQAMEIAKNKLNMKHFMITEQLNPIYLAKKILDIY